MPPGLKVVNTDDVGVSGSGTTGVVGRGISGSDPTGGGGSGAGIGVSGSGWMGVLGQGDFIGVSGGGGSGPGVLGTGTGIGVSGLGSTGVSGAGGATGVHGFGASTGVVGSSPSGPGVLGLGNFIGVEGDGGPSSPHSGVGVLGVAGPDGAFSGVGVIGDADTNGASRGITGICANGFAVVSQGDCLVQGDFAVTGSKNAVVKLRNGEQRALYCVESPECWFEDFGRARIIRGAARVRLERTFAAVVRTGDYHVFLSPEGLCQGLYVSRRGRNGFEVREFHRGKSTVAFSYRIVARRKGIDAPRFKRVKPPAPLSLPRPAKAKRPETPKLPPIPKSMRTPRLEALLKRLRSAKPASRKPRRRGSR